MTPRLAFNPKFRRVGWVLRGSAGRTATRPSHARPGHMCGWPWYIPAAWPMVARAGSGILFTGALPVIRLSAPAAQQNCGRRHRPAPGPRDAPGHVHSAWCSVALGVRGNAEGKAQSHARHIMQSMRHNSVHVQWNGSRETCASRLGRWPGRIL